MKRAEWKTKNQKKKISAVDFALREKIPKSNQSPRLARIQTTTTTTTTITRRRRKCCKKLGHWLNNWQKVALEAKLMEFHVGLISLYTFNRVVKTSELNCFDCYRYEIYFGCVVMANRFHIYSTSFLFFLANCIFSLGSIKNRRRDSPVKFNWRRASNLIIDSHTASISIEIINPE